jgi:hypothetical protein
MIVKKNFCLGISKPLDIFNKNIIDLISYAIEKDLFIHSSITYPVNFIFIKFFLKRKNRYKINFICKILADNSENFNKTVNLTLEKFSIKKIHILQLVNLPVINPAKRDSLSLKFDELNKILKSINDLKKKKIIDKVFIQIFSNDDLKFCKKTQEYFDGFAFYSNIEEIHLKKDVYEFIKNENIPCIILSVFGNPKINANSDNNLHLNSYEFSQSYFSKDTIAVGRTLKLSRLKEIYNSKKSELKKKLIFSPKYIETDEIQDTAENFYKRYKVTNLYYIFIFITKCLTKKIIGQKIWLYLNKKLKKNYED